MNLRKTILIIGLVLTDKKKNEEKKKRIKKRKEDKQMECAAKARYMVSLGPITMNSVNYFMDKGVNFEVAKKKAVLEFLQYSLGYEEDKLNALGLVETKMSPKGGEIIHVVLSNEEDVREIYYRKADLQKEDVTVRMYVSAKFFMRGFVCNQ